jgi:hypothetical protein
VKSVETRDQACETEQIIFESHDKDQKEAIEKTKKSMERRVSIVRKKSPDRMVRRKSASSRPSFHARREDQKTERLPHKPSLYKRREDLMSPSLPAVTSEDISCSSSAFKSVETPKPTRRLIGNMHTAADRLAAGMPLFPHEIR